MFITIFKVAVIILNIISFLLALYIYINHPYSLRSYLHDEVVALILAIVVSLASIICILLPINKGAIFFMVATFNGLSLIYLVLNYLTCYPSSNPLIKENFGNYFGCGMLGYILISALTMVFVYMDMVNSD